MAALGQSVPLVTVDQLKSRLEDGKTVIIDARRPADDPDGKIKIKGAVAEDWEKPSPWASKYDPEQTIVLYCA